MNVQKIASSYASAIFDLAMEQNLLPQVNDDMALSEQVLRDSREFRMVLKSPVVNNDKKQKVVRAIFQDKISDITARFFDILIKRNRESLLHDIAVQFVRLYKEHQGIKTAKVTSASGLDPKTREAMIDVLAEKLQAKIEIVEKTDKSLIGGFVLKVDHNQFDASIKKKLDRLSREFDVNIYEKGF